MTFIRWVLCIIAFSLTACEQAALLTTAPKRPIFSESRLKNEAETFFWHTFHSGNYAQIELALHKLMVVYLQNPHDPEIAAHIGFLHLWKLTERDQLVQDPMTPDQILLAQNYFSQAVEMLPHHPVYIGFLGTAYLAAGKIFKDKREEIKGYFTLKRAIKLWPQFNYFTAGYLMSTLSPNSKYYQEALQWQWETLDLCAQQKVDRKNPGFQAFMQLETNHGKQKACWNSAIAPHNFEGFFLNMGDMLVKAGQWQTAVQIYANAKFAKSYSSWPFREMLERRIKNAAHNVKNFQEDTYQGVDKTILFNSGHGCMVCHQN